MRLAYVHTGLWPSPSPSMTFSTMAATGFAEAGAECHFFVKKASRLPVHEVYEQWSGSELPEGLCIRPLRAPARWNGIFFRKVYSRLLREHFSGGLSAVITRSTKFLPWLVRFHRRTGVPVFYETHDFHADLSERDDLSSRSIRRRKRTERLERRFVPLVSAVLCLHHTQLGIYRKAFPNAVLRVAGTGVHRVEPSGGEGRFVTYIGSLEPRKGITELLKAMNLTRTKPDLLVIGGKNEEDRRTFSEAASELCPECSVTITGWLDKKVMRKHLRRTRIGVIPLRDTFFNRYLTSPLKLFDCMASGIPVVVPDLPSLRELVREGETGLFYSPESPEGMARAIDRLYGEPALLEGMRLSVLNFANGRLWTLRAEQILRYAAEAAGG